MYIKRRNSKPACFWAHYWSFIIIVVMSLMISSCTTGTPVVPPPTDPTPEISETLTAPEIHPAETPTHTATTSIPLVLLLAPPGHDPATLAELQPIFAELARAEGYQLEVRSSLTSEQINHEIKVVASLPPDPGLERLAASASNTRFLAIDIPEIAEASNLTTVLLPENRPDYEGFMAGIIAALVTPDWRVGVISISDTNEGVAARNGFLNGVVYFCGTCRQIYPPFFDSQNRLIQYPLYAELPSGAPENEWLAAADQLLQLSVETIYVYPGAGGETLLTYIAEAGAKLVGSTLPPEGLANNWVASISLDPSFSLNAAIQMAFEGQDMPEDYAALKISHVNPDLLSPGRLKLANSIMGELLAGYIEAGIIESDQDQP